MRFPGAERPLAACVALVGSTVVILAIAGAYVLPLNATTTTITYDVAIGLFGLLLMTAQISAAWRTRGLDRAMWCTMIGHDIVMFILYFGANDTLTYLPTREGLAPVWLLGPVAALQGLVVILVLSRRVIRDTNVTALAADAAWLGVAAQAVMWPIVGEPALHVGADAVTLTVILSHGFVSAALAGTFVALALRAAPGHRMGMVSIGAGIVAIRYGMVIHYGTWLADGITIGSWLNFLGLLLLVTTVWTVALAPEAAARVRGHNPPTTQLLTGSWLPIVIIAGSLWLTSFDIDGHWALLLMAAGTALVV
jgi:hypothetical protein